MEVLARLRSPLRRGLLPLDVVAAACWRCPRSARRRVSNVAPHISELPPSLKTLLQHASERGSQRGQQVTVHAWVRSVRKSKTVTFLNLDDGTLPGGETFQAVVPASGAGQIPSVGSSVRVKGTIVRRVPQKGQDKAMLELAVDQLATIADCDAMVGGFLYESEKSGFLTLLHRHTPSRRLPPLRRCERTLTFAFVARRTRRFCAWQISLSTAYLLGSA